MRSNPPPITTSTQISSFISRSLIIHIRFNTNLCPTYANFTCSIVLLLFFQSPPTCVHLLFCVMLSSIRQMEKFSPKKKIKFLKNNIHCCPNEIQILFNFDFIFLLYSIVWLAWTVAITNDRIFGEIVGKNNRIMEFTKCFGIRVVKWIKTCGNF